MQCPWKTGLGGKCFILQHDIASDDSKNLKGNVDENLDARLRLSCLLDIPYIITLEMDCQLIKPELPLGGPLMHRCFEAEGPIHRLALPRYPKLAEASSYRICRGF
ncbi:hypothetical protein M514_06123 [Trichuris suis]|uniref:Uncharacterized protein n=1 Tax=Trichuris suis TaxID=68888 RepID=A0A085M711_9BILA|nr:hypothetical protein M513_06123 [Trichuris suis]KFD69860.1 hypothetical protein M514_06123 [Trichuris suis]